MQDHQVIIQVIITIFKNVFFSANLVRKFETREIKNARIIASHEF